MTTLQIVPQKSHASFLHKSRSVKRAHKLSRDISTWADSDMESEGRSKNSPEPGGVNLESLYFRGFRSRPLLNPQEELELATRLYQGTASLRSLLQRALHLGKGL
jgi:hypothetical protein